MMGLRRLLAMRRQSGKVKISFLLFGLAGYFAVTCLLQAGTFAVRLGRPVEYILSPGVDGPVSDARMEALRQRKEVAAVSRQREYTLTAGERPLTVTELSEEYLSGCYGLNQQGAGSVFWLSGAAWEGFFGSVSGVQRLAYQEGEKAGSGVFELAESLPADTVLAVTKGNSLTLGESATLRVMLKGRDLSGEGVAAMEALGFSVVNRERLLADGYETKLFLTRLRYSLAGCALALLAGQVLYAAGKKEYAGK